MTRIANSIPQLNEGEIYAGAIIQLGGHENHIILLPEQLEKTNYPDAVSWAESKGGCLPTEAELRHLFAVSRAAKLRGDIHIPHFHETFYYWSAGQLAVHSGTAASKLILSGNYQPGPEGTYIRACAIRRVVALDI